MSKSDSAILSAARKLGFKKLRSGQRRAIRSLLDGHDTLVVMPTGSGKSAIYQIAGLLLEGPTIVVSPLIALQRDQVDSINDKKADNAEATVINSTLKTAERIAVMEEIEGGEVEFIFLAPEQFQNAETLERLSAAKPSLFVVDEAHCVSAWGHDFRPDYLKLDTILETLGHPVTLAITATASPPVREEITQRLTMREPRTVVQGFNRPNIHLGIRPFNHCHDKLPVLLEHVQARVGNGQKPGIIYTATRKEAEEVTNALHETGVKAVCYHAGLKAGDRDDVQRTFMDGEADVIVATVAFGMGIDKPNVRWVFHLDVSDSLDSYYQEIGRAGRDGKPAEAILFYCQQDLGMRRFFNAGGRFTPAEVRRVFKLASGNQLDAKTIAAQAELSQPKTEAILCGLKDAHALESSAISKTKVAEVVESQEARRRFDQSRLEMMQGYAETGDCLRKFLLNYFGEAYEPTGKCCCINCEKGTVESANAKIERPFALNARVAHATLGAGQVMRYEEDKMVVLFDNNGYKTLGVELVLENGLLSGE